MPEFSADSLSQLGTCSPRLQKILRWAIQGGPDFSIVEGKRSLERQKELLEEGLTQTLHSKHVWPQQAKSLAVDVVPFVKGEQIWVQRPTGLQGAMWKAVRRYAKRWAQMAFLAGWIMAKADTLGIKLRWGGDWNEDFDFADNSFDDIWHFELKSQAEQ